MTTDKPRTHGWVHPYEERSWDSIAKQLDLMGETHPQFWHVAAVAHSVIAESASHLLAGFTSMHDIAVLPRPTPSPPFDVVWVRAPSSFSVPPGQVVIEHVSCTGLRDCIERPASETLPLFWRFMIEKFGVYPPNRARP